MEVGVTAINSHTDPTVVYGENPDNYHQSRIAYLPGFVGRILEESLASVWKKPLSPDAEEKPRIVDLGAGTGRLGQVCMDLGCDVTFVEPNSNSISFLQNKYGSIKGAQVLQAEASNMRGIPDHSVDAVVIGDAAHWIHGAGAIQELQRILRPGGEVVVFSRFWSQVSPLTVKVDELLRKSACRKDYMNSPNKLMRGPVNLRNRIGRHLVNIEENTWSGYTLLAKYDNKEDLLHYFGTLSFSSHAVATNPDDFMKQVIDPLWEFAAEKGFIRNGKMCVPYETNALYGPPPTRYIPMPGIETTEIAR